jgi:uncharacterized protein
MPSEWEVRSFDLRANEEGLLEGFVPFNRLSEDLGGVREIIEPGAFTRTLKEYPDVFALVEHDPAKVLGRTTNGTLRLSEDNSGLNAVIDPADTTYGRDITELVRRGDIRGLSFRFRPFPGGYGLDLASHPPIRRLTSVRISEVSIVGQPAYPDTTVLMRDIEAARNTEMTKAMMRLRLALMD